jgi:hypothetical protein
LERPDLLDFAAAWCGSQFHSFTGRFFESMGGWVHHRWPSGQWTVIRKSTALEARGPSEPGYVSRGWRAEDGRAMDERLI